MTWTLDAVCALICYSRLLCGSGTDRVLYLGMKVHMRRQDSFLLNAVAELV
jgi:hypothetical protein